MSDTSEDSSRKLMILKFVFICTAITAICFIFKYAARTTQLTEVSVTVRESSSEPSDANKTDGKGTPNATKDLPKYKLSLVLAGESEGLVLAPSDKATTVFTRKLDKPVDIEDLTALKLFKDDSLVAELKNARKWSVQDVDLSVVDKARTNDWSYILKPYVEETYLKGKNSWIRFSTLAILLIFIPVVLFILKKRYKHNYTIRDILNLHYYLDADKEELDRSSAYKVHDDIQGVKLKDSRRLDLWLKERKKQDNEKRDEHDLKIFGLGVFIIIIIIDSLLIYHPFHGIDEGITFNIRNYLISLGLSVVVLILLLGLRSYGKRSSYSWYSWMVRKLTKLKGDDQNRSNIKTKFFEKRMGLIKIWFSFRMQLSFAAGAIIVIIVLAKVFYTEKIEVVADQSMVTSSLDAAKETLFLLEFYQIFLSKSNIWYDTLIPLEIAQGWHEGKKEGVQITHYILFTIFLWFFVPRAFWGGCELLIYKEKMRDFDFDHPRVRPILKWIEEGRRESVSFVKQKEATATQEETETEQVETDATREAALARQKDPNLREDGKGVTEKDIATKGEEASDATLVYLARCLWSNKNAISIRTSIKQNKDLGAVRFVEAKNWGTDHFDQDAKLSPGKEIAIALDADRTMVRKQQSRLIKHILEKNLKLKVVLVFDPQKETYVAEWKEKCAGDSEVVSIYNKA